MCVLVSVRRRIILYTAAIAQKKFLFEVFYIECSGVKPSYGFQNRQKIIVIFNKKG